jgi:hypothetical protein
MDIMMAGDSAAARYADEGSDGANERPTHRGAGAAGAMPLQSDRGYEAAPQMFVRLTGSHLAKPRVSRNVVITG